MLQTALNCIISGILPGIYPIYGILSSFALGLPKYTIEARKHCYDSKKKEFANFEDAEKECSNDKTCGGIWNDKCEGARFFTCGMGQDWLEISSKSCVLTKTQGQ